MRCPRTALITIVAGLLAVPGLVSAQARPQPRAAKEPSRIWIAPYVGFGFQNAYYDGVVQFSDGSSDFLTVDPGTGVLLGLQVGYSLSPKLTLHGGLSTASPNAEYIEDLTPRPTNDLRTTQFDVGLLYDAASVRVGRDRAPLAVGGGLSVTSHSLNRMTWDGNAIRPRTTSIGAHGLATLDIPVASKLTFHGQAKLSLTPLSLGDLEEKIAAAEGGGLTASLDAGTSTYFQMLFGVAYRP